MEAYLDIETTGLSVWSDQITVVGIYLCNGNDTKFVQFVGEDITADNILEVLRGVGSIYTYNGSRFDLPFINYCLGINLAKLCKHCDLLYPCWENGLCGGLKWVERQLGIARRLKNVDGNEAVKLWWRYVNDSDEDALSTLLRYNEEDVLNLKLLKERLLYNPSLQT